MISTSNVLHGDPLINIPQHNCIDVRSCIVDITQSKRHAFINVRVLNGPFLTERVLHCRYQQYRYQRNGIYIKEATTTINNSTRSRISAICLRTSQSRQMNG